MTPCGWYVVKQKQKQILPNENDKNDSAVLKILGLIFYASK